MLEIWEKVLVTSGYTDCAKIIENHVFYGIKCMSTGPILLIVNKAGHLEINQKQIKISQQNKTKLNAIPKIVKTLPNLLKHRFLDLRGPELQRNLKIRYNITRVARNELQGSVRYPLL